MYYIRRSADSKEGIMKRLIYITLVLMIGLIVMGCAGMTTEQRKEETSLTTSVGNAPFVGFSSTDSLALTGAFGAGQK